MIIKISRVLFIIVFLLPQADSHLIIPESCNVEANQEFTSFKPAFIQNRRLTGNCIFSIILLGIIKWRIVIVEIIGLRIQVKVIG